MSENKKTKVLSVVAIIISIFAVIIMIGIQRNANYESMKVINKLKMENRILYGKVETLEISNVLSTASEGVNLLNVEHVHIDDENESVLIRVSLGDYDSRSSLRDIETSIEKIIDNTIRSCSNVYQKDISSYKFAIAGEDSRVLARYKDEDIEFTF